MKKKLMLLAFLLAVLAFTPKRTASALSTCSNSYCASHPTADCVCPSSTFYPGSIAYCGAWKADCNRM